MKFATVLYVMGMSSLVAAAPQEIEKPKPPVLSSQVSRPPFPTISVPVGPPRPSGTGPPPMSSQPAPPRPSGSGRPPMSSKSTPPRPSRTPLSSRSFTTSVRPTPTPPTRPTPSAGPVMPSLSVGVPPKPTPVR